MPNRHVTGAAHGLQAPLFPRPPPSSSVGPYLRYSRRTPELVVFLPTPQPADPNNRLGGECDPRTHIGAVHLASRQPTLRTGRMQQSWNLWRRVVAVQAVPVEASAGVHPPLPHLACSSADCSVPFIIPSIPNSFVASISLSSSVPELFRGSPIKTTRLLYMTLINSHKFLAFPSALPNAQGHLRPRGWNTGTGDTDDNPV